MSYPQPPNDQPEWQLPPQHTQYPQQSGQLPPQYTQYSPYQQMPPPPPQQPSIWKRKYGCMPVWLITLLCGIFLLCGLISYAANGNKSTSTTTQTTDTTSATNSAQIAATNNAGGTVSVPTATLNTSIPTSTPAPTQAPAKWVTTHKFTGTGDKQTPIFSVPDNWRINWTCDARNNYGVEGFIGINVHNSDGTSSYAGDVSGNCAANKVTSDSSEEHQGGDVYLKVFAGIPWTIEVQEFK